MNLYTLRDMRDARLSSLLPKVYHKCTRELLVYIHTQTPSSDSNVVFIPRSHTKNVQKLAPQIQIHASASFS